MRTSIFYGIYDNKILKPSNIYPNRPPVQLNKQKLTKMNVSKNVIIRISHFRATDVLF